MDKCVQYIDSSSTNGPIVEEKPVPFILETKWNTNHKIL